MTLALRHGAFRRIAALYSLNCFVEWFGTIALMVLVYRATDGNALAATAMLLCKQIVPAGLIPTIGGVLDRLDLGRAAAVAFAVHASGLALLVSVGYGVWVYPVAAVIGTSAGISRSSLRAAVARTLSGVDLRSGNAFLNTVVAFAMTVGPAAAGLAVATVGNSAALLLGAGGLGLLALCTLRLRVPPLVAESDSALEPEVSTAGHAAHRLPVGWILAAAALVLCGFAMDEPVLLQYSERSLGAGVSGYGAIYAAWGVGLAIGSVLFARLLDRRMIDVWLVATLVSAVGYLGLGLSPTIVISCAVAVVGGIGNGMSWVALVTAVQEAERSGREARATVRLEAIATGAPAIGILLGGVVGDVLGPRAALVLPGIAAILVVLVTVVLLRGRIPAAARVPKLVPTSAPGGSA